MSLRTRPEGYGSLARGLHWLTVAALLAQVVVGYAMDWDDDGGSGRGRGRGRGGDDDAGSGRGRGRGGDDRVDEGGEAVLGDDLLVSVHVALGLTILVLAVLRLLRRRLDGLPAWDERLSERDRRWASRIERTLLVLLFAAPLSGLVLVLTREDDWLPLHVATHLALYATVALHVALVLRRGLLRRMLRGARAS